MCVCVCVCAREGMYVLKLLFSFDCLMNEIVAMVNDAT